MTVFELDKEQLIQLKQSYLMQHLNEVDNRSPSWKEMSDADETVPDELVFEAYSGTDFSSDDFYL